MHTTEGIILKIENFRENDERVILYTKEFGKLTVVAKGAKKIEAKLRGNLNTFTRVNTTFVPGASFNILTGVESAELFLHLNSSPHTYKCAISIARLVDNIFEENVKDEDFFNALNYAIEKLCEYSFEPERLASLYSWLLFKKFQMKILENQGYEDSSPANYTPSNLASADSREWTLTANSSLLVDMLNGKKIQSITLSKDDINNIENVFSRMFAYFFSYKSNSWIPIMN